MCVYVHVCVCMCVCENEISKSFSNETLKFFLSKVLHFLHFGSCKNYMSSVNQVAEIY